MSSAMRLGDMLLQSGVITDDQLTAALADQQKTGARLGDTLVKFGFASESQILNIIAKQRNIDFVDLNTVQIESEYIQLLPETFARRYRAIVIGANKHGLIVGMADPLDIFAQDDLKRVLNAEFSIVLVREKDLLHTLDITYRRTDEITDLAEELSQELADDPTYGQVATDYSATDAPVIKLSQSILEDAIQVGASDIHIEPDDKVLRIRQRVDGVLQEQVMQERHISTALTLRFKLMAGLDISEKRLPQDGRFTTTIKGKRYDVRISTIPIQFGESIVLRLLDTASVQFNLENCGMPEHMLDKFRQLIHCPHGVIIVTGPTGSGKTTTLYGALSELNNAETKIITIEDPIEYNLSRINQVQINSKIDLTFAKVLRAILRQDPDVILIGEMRDQETAEIGMRAAMTGHMVLASLHTNDTISSIVRLLDMGIDAHILASTLRGIVAQRLVRRICNHCISEVAPTEQQSIWLSGLDERLRIPKTFSKGKGCSHCNYTGYSGRIGIFELLCMDSDMMEALRGGDVQHFTRVAQENRVSRTLLYSAMEAASKGITSLDEVLRIIGEVDSFHDEENVAKHFEIKQSGANYD